MLINTPAMAQTNDETTFIETPELNGDAEKGSVVFFRCRACHDISKNENSTKIGPNLFGILGKKAGTVSNYKNYSKAMLDTDFIWNEKLLDNWLKNPNGFLPGNTMAFSGVMRQVDRDNLIAFIRKQKADD